MPRRFNRVHRALRSAFTSTIRPLQQYQYSLYDLQYVFLFVLFSFCYWIMDKPVWFKLPIASAAVALLIPRRTRQFMLPLFAIVSWLILFYCCRFIPSSWRPHIFTTVLPALENILYGGSISEMLASSTTPFKDILAWIPYGVLHYVLPIIVAILIAFFAPPGTLPVFARTFGYMNVSGVMTQILFPCAPPWYETRYGGLQPAAYTMPGDPGGLARVDDILGVEMYKTTFTASPLVFGAFPSLHSADACLIAFFAVYVFGPRSIPFALGYIFWIWWATMYLGHHYVVDLVGGGAYAVIAFWIGSKFLPSVLPPQEPEYLPQGKSKGVYESNGVVDRLEKQTLFNAPDQDEELDLGSSSSNVYGWNADKPWELGQDSDEDTELGRDRLKEESTDGFEMNSVAVDVLKFSSGYRIDEEGRTGGSEPPSPTGSHHSVSSATTVSSWTQKKKRMSTSSRQSWIGWQGYESWIEVLATVNSPKSTPRSSPVHSPRSSSPNLSSLPF
ncbi:Aureobasidin resistance protein Aur1 [Dissophora globulifera]|uniref:Aureobasidin resistance protein Aur1 n=1 Tax=Dissophora globulifera TaxID=979702 RepID=A0A9P6RZ71_9FUNG|nr:Aureobasidin resistance protein Aur1 [Dissophora globulifera]